jgi:succinate--hydroxymethylglutarate CoA-transferase
LIRAKLAEAFKGRTRDEWLELFGDEEVCVGPVYELDEVFDDPQAQARGLVVEVDHPRAGKLRQLGLPFVLDGLDPQAVIRQPSPGFGEHNDAVMTALGYSPEDLERLRLDGVIGQE